MLHVPPGGGPAGAGDAAGTGSIGGGIRSPVGSALVAPWAWPELVVVTTGAGIKPVVAPRAWLDCANGIVGTVGAVDEAPPVA